MCRPPNSLILLLTVFLSSLYSSGLSALESDKYKEIIIYSNSAKLNAKTGVVVYTGNVELYQGTIKITADELTVIKKDGKVDRAIAVGKTKQATYQQQIKLNQGLTKARSNRITYSHKNNKAEFIGKAFLTQMGNQVKGERIVYDIAKETALVGSKTQPLNDERKKSRVKVIIQPETPTGKKSK